MNPMQQAMMQAGYGQAEDPLAAQQAAMANYRAPMVPQPGGGGQMGMGLNQMVNQAAKRKPQAMQDEQTMSTPGMQQLMASM